MYVWGGCVKCFCCELLLSSSTSSFSSSLRGGAVVQIKQLSDQSLSKLRSTVAFDCVGVRHLVQDVCVVDGNTDAQPEHLLPCLVRLVEDEVPVRRNEPITAESLYKDVNNMVLFDYLQLWSKNIQAQHIFAILSLGF